MKPDIPITLDDMRGFAREYITAMRIIQPRGPYFIGGMCAGTHIAEQMVLQLEAEGEKVALFAVFDTWVRQNTQIRWKWLIYYYRQRVRELVRLGIKQQLATVREAVTKKVRRLSTPFGKSVETSWAKLYWPGKEFKIPLFEAPVALFKRPRQPFYYLRDEAMGWGERSLGGVHIYRIDFPHRMLRDPYVRELARRLLACIAGASSPTRLERLQVWPTVSATQPWHSDTRA